MLWQKGSVSSPRHNVMMIRAWLQITLSSFRRSLSNKSVCQSDQTPHCSSVNVRLIGSPKSDLYHFTDGKLELLIIENTDSSFITRKLQ